MQVAKTKESANQVKICKTRGRSRGCMQIAHTKEGTKRWALNESAKQIKIGEGRGSQTGR